MGFVCEEKPQAGSATGEMHIITIIVVVVTYIPHVELELQLRPARTLARSHLLKFFLPRKTGGSFPSNLPLTDLPRPGFKFVTLPEVNCAGIGSSAS